MACVTFTDSGEAGEQDAAVPAARGPAQEATAGEAGAGREGSTEGSETSEAPDTPALTWHVSDPSGPAAFAVADT